MINKRLKDALFTDQWSELFMDALGPFNFVLVTPPSTPGQLETPGLLGPSSALIHRGARWASVAGSMKWEDGRADL